MARTAAHGLTTDRVRAPAVAGMFYPGRAETLRAMVTQMLDAGAARLDEAWRRGGAMAVIAPHAGYVYSGPVAGTAFAAVGARRGQVRRVVNIGPSHRVAFDGVAAPDADVAAFATPLGEVAVDCDAVATALQLPRVRRFDAAHAQEHALETHLPFLQLVLGSFAYVPLVFGDAEPGDIAAVLDRLWTDDTLIAVSSDLSHYLDNAAARRLDRATADAIERLDPESIGSVQACGRLAIQALLQCAASRGWSARTLDLRTSGDTAGPRDSVVGYGAFAFA